MPDLVRISKEVQFDAGHRVPNHKSKCRNPHGHRYRVVVHCEGTIIETPGASDEGMLVDFSDLKTIMTERIHDVLDHGFIVYENDLDMLNCLAHSRVHGTDDQWKVIVFPSIPTAENIALWCWNQIDKAIKESFGSNLWLYMVEVWETPTSCAKYMGESRFVS